MSRLSQLVRATTAILVTCAPGFPGTTSASPAEKVGGSNFAWYAMDGCSRDNFGITSDYPKNKGAIDGVIRQMYQNGQRRLRLPVFYANGSQNPTVLKVDGGGLTSQDRDNFKALIATISQIGFEELIVGSFPLGPNNPVPWPQWQEDRYQENLTVIAQLRQIMDSSGLPYKLDLQNEGVPFPFQLMLKQYVQRIWHDYVRAYGPTRTIGVSAIPLAGRIKEIPSIYNGVLPEAFDLHVTADAYNDLREVDGILRTLGISDTPFIIGEAYYNDEAEASELEKAARSIGRRVIFLTQWPITRSSTCKDVSVIPLEFNAYRAHGF